MEDISGIGLVYFLHADGTNLVKVGWTSDLNRRFDHLQTACPHRLRLLGVHIGTREVEAIYHQDLAPYKQRGEWFFLTREVRRCFYLGLKQHYESSQIAWRFWFDRVGGDDDHEQWVNEIESFAGVPGSQPTWTDSLPSGTDMLATLGELLSPAIEGEVSDA